MNQGRALLRKSKAQQMIACVCRISSQPSFVVAQVSHSMGSLVGAPGLIPLGIVYTWGHHNNIFTLLRHWQTTAIATDNTVDLFLWLQTRDNHPGQTHSRLSKCNVADHLCLPNQPIIAEWSLHAETVNCIFGTRDSRGHVCHSPQHASSPVYVSNPGPLSTCYR